LEGFKKLNLPIGNFNCDYFRDAEFTDLAETSSSRKIVKKETKRTGNTRSDRDRNSKRRMLYKFAWYVWI